MSLTATATSHALHPRQADEVGRARCALRDAGLTSDDAARGAYALIVQVVGFVALEVAETDARPPLAPEAERVAGRRAALEFLDPADWPLSAATKEVAAGWISTDQFARQVS